MGLSRKGRAYGAAGAVRARAKRGRSARAQAGAGGRGGAPQERPPRRLRLQTGVRLLLRPFYLGVAAEKEFCARWAYQNIKKYIVESVSLCVVRRQLVVLVARRNLKAMGRSSKPPFNIFALLHRCLDANLILPDSKYIPCASARNSYVFSAWAGDEFDDTEAG